MIIIGYLKPGIADAKIAIEITSKRKRLLYHVNTDVDGKYVLELQDIRIGSWSVQAFFDGDMMNAPAQSSSQSVKWHWYDSSHSDSNFTYLLTLGQKSIAWSLADLETKKEKVVKSAND